jgi:hypothetical protein
MAMPDCTADKLRKLIAGYLGVDASRVTDEAHLSDDLGIEWLDQSSSSSSSKMNSQGSSFRTRRRLNSSAICSAT